jgi:hypothetical protein
MILFEDSTLTPDLVAASFFNKDALREAPRKLYRYDGADGRWYYTVPDTTAAGETARARLYPSVTTVLRQAGPMPPYLLKWTSDYGQRRASQIAQEKADYGTLLHILFGEFVIASEVDLDGIAASVLEWSAFKRLPWDTVGWAEMLRQDLVGLAAFLLEHEFRPLGVEVPLASDELGYAGCLDLVGYCGADPEPAIVDFKSNRNAFYPEQEIQLAAYRTLWNENFPEFKANRLILWGSKDWDQDSPSRYRKKNVKEGPNTTTKFPALLRLWEMDHQNGSRQRASISGRLKLSDFSGVNITFRSLEEALAERQKA